MPVSDIIYNTYYAGMWVKLYAYCILWTFSILRIHSHLPSYVSTPSNKIEQFCELADTCVHDTIPICGRMGDEKRTFLDLCDLLEFACDTNQDVQRNINSRITIFTHVDDMEGCPLFRTSNS